MEPGGTRQG